MANIVGINFESIVDGDGVRVVIFFSGCYHDCKGCHNPTSHDFDAGRLFSGDIQGQIAEYIRETPFISGVTLSGGDPMYSATDIIPFIKNLRAIAPSTTVWVYSGFTLEEIQQDQSMLELLNLCDVLVDGEFMLDLRDTTLSYRGSRNQRLIDIRKSLSEGKTILWNVSNE